MKTDNPNCFITSLYKSLTEVSEAGLPNDQEGSEVYICNKAGEMKAPMTFPMKTSQRHKVHYHLPE